MSWLGWAVLAAAWVMGLRAVLGDRRFHVQVLGFLALTGAAGLLGLLALAG